MTCFKRELGATTGSVAISVYSKKKNKLLSVGYLSSGKVMAKNLADKGFGRFPVSQTSVCHSDGK